VDPVVVAAHVITALQTIVSRNVDPLDSGVVTVGQVHAGAAFNVIPSEAFLEGTVRSFSKEAGRVLPRRLREVAAGVARALGASVQVEYVHEHNPVVNDAAMADFMRSVARDVVGKKNVLDPPPSMGGEDHSLYQELVPGCYVFLGAGTAKGEAFPHHHPRFNPDESVLPIGVELMALAARRWLDRN
jgi:amidohydrolase